MFGGTEFCCISLNSVRFCSLLAILLGICRILLRIAFKFARVGPEKPLAGD